MSPHPDVAYAELHCHTNFSFLDGASHAHELVATAAELGYRALAVVDHDGFRGAVKVHEAARAIGLPVVYGTEVGLPQVDRFEDRPQALEPGIGEAAKDAPPPTQPRRSCLGALLIPGTRSRRAWGWRGCCLGSEA